MKSEDLIEIEHELHKLMCQLFEKLSELEKKIPKKLNNRIQKSLKGENHGTH